MYYKYTTKGTWMMRFWFYHHSLPMPDVITTPTPPHRIYDTTFTFDKFLKPFI